MHLRGTQVHLIIEQQKASYLGYQVLPPQRAESSTIGWSRRSRADFSDAAREGATGMASMATRASDANEDLAVMAGAAVLGSLTIPGRPEHVREARSFVAKSLGDLHPRLPTAEIGRTA